ncbi:apolipoprotein N-acyltransferase [Amaricoccus solimangrovi]|uniref:Apolipoprotein N-acyltransferase n=1 Tax=Amaricoccus solimangrovi TaxID=2589815 RepID=A0A501WTC6_9RHOB|nr:apolipoprotein N-acyltransferase [Amaricoccus solimangrovi]TPE50211.1 apolipoprotein N-acyltransferase [Amaricoccus solimangrovi]
MQDSLSRARRGPGVARAMRGLGAWRRAGLGLLAGVALAGTQPPLSWPALIFLALPALLWLMDGVRAPRGAFALGWCVGVGYFGAGMFWIVDPFLVEPEVFGWLAPFALVGMAGGMALFWGWAFALARLFWHPGWSRAVLFAAVWALVEFARGHVLTGFPWALPAYAWIDTPVAQVLSLTGPYGLTFLTLAAGLLPGVGRPAAVAGAVGLVVLGWGFGAWRLAEPLPVRAEPVRVRLVQPNMAQDEKWLPGREEEFFRRHLALSADGAGPRPDVTIWSETAVAFILDRDPAAQAAAAASVGPDGHLLLGIRRAESAGEDWSWFNSLAALAPDGTTEAVYDKARLVPFGEYIPLKGLAARLGIPALTTLTRGGFTAGPGPRVVSVPGVPPFLPLICYEAIFPAAARAPGERPDWLVQVTNDAWFGEASGPYQHFAQARARAIEQGLPLARAANTGISAMVDPKGRVVAELGLGAQGHVDAPLPAPLPPTVYSRTGDIPVLLILFTIYLLTATVFVSGILKPSHR